LIIGKFVLWGAEARYLQRYTIKDNTNGLHRCQKLNGIKYQYRYWWWKMDIHPSSETETASRIPLLPIPEELILKNASYPTV
jgi:hypothetical protein